MSALTVIFWVLVGGFLGMLAMALAVAMDDDRR